MKSNQKDEKEIAIYKDRDFKLNRKEETKINNEKD